MTDNRVAVPDAVMTGLEAVRESGLCKLFDVPCVLSWLAVHSYRQTEQWIRENHDDYISGVMHGFEAAS